MRSSTAGGGWFSTTLEICPKNSPTSARASRARRQGPRGVAFGLEFFHLGVLGAVLARLLRGPGLEMFRVALFAVRQRENLLELIEDQHGPDVARPPMARGQTVQQFPQGLRRRGR